MESPFIIWLAVSIVMFVLTFVWPEFFRFFAGFFFIVMGLGVNLLLLLTAPEQFELLGSESFIPIYRQIFQEGVAKHTTLFVVPVIVLELAIGLAMLARGMNARIGVIAAIGFLSATAPMHPVNLPNLVAALAFAALLRTSFDRSFPDLIRQSFRSRSIRRAARHA